MRTVGNFEITKIGRSRKLDEQHSRPNHGIILASQIERNFL
jgi:hypothetical protein